MYFIPDEKCIFRKSIPKLMNKNELASVIQQELDKTASLIRDLEQEVKPIAPENAIGRVSRMDAINNKSVNEAALNEARKKYAQLQYAQNRLDDDDFGTCSRCGNQIPLGRLLFMPQSRLCVNCAV